MKYRLQVTTNINHAYEIEADSAEHAEQIYTQYTPEQLAALDLDGSASREQYPWDVEDVTEVNNWNDFLNSDAAKQLDENAATLQIASASSAVASPELSAALVNTRALAENPCTGGEFVGFGVFCSDGTSEWIETGFPDDAAAERFADAWRNYSDENRASVALVMNANRDQWEEKEPETIGARCLIRWERHRSGSDQELDLVVTWDELDRYISFSEYNEESDCDTFGVPDDQIFYYATREEFQKLCINGEYHHDGWELVSFEWVTR